MKKNKGADINARLKASSTEEDVKAVYKTLQEKIIPQVYALGFLRP